MSAESTNFFKKMNRQQRREFDKLPKEEQISVIAYEIRKGMIDEFNKQITNAFYRGHLNASKFLYDKYVKEYLELTKDSENIEACADIVGKCFAEIATIAEKFDEQFPIVEEMKETENKGE